MHDQHQSPWQPLGRRHHEPSWVSEARKPSVWDMPRNIAHAARYAEYSASGTWPSDTLAELIRAAALSGGGTSFEIVSELETAPVTLEWISREALSLADSLAREGFEPGDVLGAILPAGYEAFISFYAATLLGAVFAVAMPYYAPGEAVEMLARCQPKVTICDGEWCASAESAGVDLRGLSPIVTGPGREGGPRSWTHVVRGGDWETALTSQARGSDPSLAHSLFFTSGTSAMAKAVVHSEHTLRAGATALFGVLELDAASRFLHCWPTGHGLGTVLLVAPLLTGCDVVITPNWEPGLVARALGEHAVSATFITPFWLEELLRLPDPGTAGPLAVLVGGDRLDGRLIRAAEPREWTLFEIYGASETGLTFRRAVSDGTRPFVAPVGTELRVVDLETGAPVAEGSAGEIQFSGTVNFLGYLESDIDKDIVTDDGWIRTGDTGVLSDDGLHLSGRVKDIIIRGGENISLSEIDELLKGFPGARDAAAVGDASAVGGERLVACVVPHPGQQPSLLDLIGHLKSVGVSRHKIPKVLCLVDAIPRNSNGKVLRAGLARRLTTAESNG